jgi:hypothetical protein
MGTLLAYCPVLEHTTTQQSPSYSIHLTYLLVAPTSGSSNKELMFAHEHIDMYALTITVSSPKIATRSLLSSSSTIFIYYKLKFSVVGALHIFNTRCYYICRTTRSFAKPTQADRLKMIMWKILAAECHIPFIPIVDLDETDPLPSLDIP